MAENTLDVRLLHAAKTLADWNNVTTIPKLGEVCLEIQGNTPPLNYKIKIGDGSSTYTALPYFGTVVNTSGNASVVVVDTITDGLNPIKVLKFYKFTLTTSTVNGVTTITPTIGDLILTVLEGEGINFLTDATDTSVKIELEATTADTAQIIADGGTFTAVTKDSSDRATKYTTFTLPSIANSINALDVADSTVITAEWDSTNKQIKFYYAKETDGIIQKGSLAYTINATDIAPLQTITTTDTGNSGLEITTSNNVKDVHHKAVTQNIVDNSSIVGEKELNVITNVNVDSYGHITGYTKDKSTNLVAADIKAPVRQSDDSMWNHRVTGGTINIGEDTAKIPVLKGNTIVWNQICKDEEITLVDENINGSQFAWSIPENHKIYISCKVKMTSDYTGGDTYFKKIDLAQGGNTWGGSIYFSNVLADNTYHQISGVANNNRSSNNSLYYRSGNPSSGSISFKDAQVIDLTKLFGSDANAAAALGVSDLTTGDNPSIAAANFEKLFPNSYYPYNEGELLSLNPDGVKSVGFNLWDEEWEVGGINTDGSVTPNNNQFRSKNYIPAFPSTTYYIKSNTSSGIQIFEYDINKRYLARNFVNNTTITTNVNTKYLKFRTPEGYVTYNHDICINLSDPNRNGTYEPYKESTLDLSWIKSIKDTGGNQLFPYGLLSAGSVHDEVGDNYAVKRIGSVDLGTLTWGKLAVYEGEHYYFSTNNLNSDIKKPINNDAGVIANIICQNLMPVEGFRVYYGNIGIGYFVGNSMLVARRGDVDDSITPEQFKAAMNGVMLYYELAEPVTVYFDKKPMTYPVDDLGTETLLPDGVDSTTGVPLSAPFNGTFEYKSNFKDTVLDLIDRVNNARNPVKGVTNTNQTVDKLAVYDSVETVKSSNYSPSNATIVEGATGNDFILPSVETIVNYVNTKLSSALNYKGTISQWSDLPTSGQNTGDMYIADTTFTEGSDTYQAGDFFIWNGTDWDIVSGTTSVVNGNPTLTPNGNTYQVGTVDGRPLQVTTPNLNTSSSTISSDGDSIVFIDNVSQTDGLISATKKTIPTATTGVNGVKYDILVPPSTSLWSSIYAPIYAGTDGQILKSNGIGAPTWTDLSLSDLSLYSKKFSYKLNSSTATELGTIIRGADSDLTLPEFYAPITAGNQYNLLMSNGSGAPSWTNFSTADGGYLKKTANGGWSLIGDSNLFFPNEDVWFYQSLPQGVSALDIAVGAQPSGIELNFYGGDGITLKKVVNASQHVLGVQINASPIVNTLQTLSSNSDTGYLRKTATDTWELDPYGGGAKESVMNDGSVITASSSATAGLRKQTGTSTYEYQKISFAAITNDTATGNNAVTIILNGNFN